MTIPEQRPDDRASPEAPAGRQRLRIGVKEYAVVVAFVGVLAGMGLVGWRRVEDHRARSQAETDLRHLGIAMRAYQDHYWRFPSPWFIAYPTEEGLPLRAYNRFSWRLWLTPFRASLSGGPVFDPRRSWDSPENAAMARCMPRTLGPVSLRPLPTGYTYYRMFAGEHAAFDKPERVLLRDLADPANTMLVVEAQEPVFWLEPEGLPYDPDKPLPPLGGTFHDGFYALFADESVRFVRHDTDERLIRSWITGRPLR